MRIVGVVGPLLFVLALELIRLFLIEGGFSDYRPHIVLALSTLVAIVAFSFVMFHFIGRAQGETAEVVADLRRRQREGHAFYDVLLRISNQEALPDILAAVARHARDLLAGDAAALYLNDATTRSVQLDPALAGAASLREGICISPDAEDSYSLEDPERMRRLSSSSEFGEGLRLEVQTPDRKLGELWVGRRHAVPFSERDRQFLATFADFASIAVTGARMRESERQAAILAERERIARELHDSLAQVLGAVHLRLRSLASRGEAELPAATAIELTELADVCEEGYRDARGAILDLHESSRSDRNLLEGLRAYLDKYSRQCGIAASLDTDLEHDLALPPSSEIQIIRVIQEALANVRKHSGAASAIVRIAQADGRATFLIEDNGRGFDATEALLDRDGFGLHAMRQRMELIGGDLLTDSAAGRGTRVVATVPEVPARAPIASSR
ncbi:MAG TPA: ATP-binding protein [Solirubrobacterales bacterium]|nr:ATP-binding protein [Solirubrobacterales bacterium]